MFEHRLHLSKIGHTFLNGVSLSDLIWTYVVTGAYCLVQGRVWRFHQRQQIASWPIELDFQFESWGRKPHADRLDPLSTSLVLRRVEVTHKKNRLEPLSSVLNLRTEVENHTQTPLDSLSTLVKMTKVEGNGTVKCQIIHCNLHGVMEFYRFG